ncbi:hypothetical protein CPC08DRAFT_672182 [Agrocybe pediades]|nr:hypothetical protein CPC08DRAFT_672182 [Agrocybe pediades]
MPDYLKPLVDDKNPFYCPSIPAAAYLTSVRNRIQANGSTGVEHLNLSQAFARVLGQSSRGANFDGEKATSSDWIFGDSFSTRHEWFSSPSPVQDDLPPYSPIAGPRRAKPEGLATTDVAATARDDLKRKNLFSDLGAPPKYARSIQSVHESSFDLDIHPETLHFSQSIASSPLQNGNLARPQALDEDKNSSLIAKLDTILPGIRLKERLSAFIDGTPQDLMDYLAKNGYINERTLQVFRLSSVRRIAFAPSMFDENGLNLSGSEVYSVFDNRENFLSLHELSFTGVRIKHSDLLHIHHLPCLSILTLEKSGIGNEGVFLLVSLKNTLTRLSLAVNPDIDNDAVPAIILLHRLCFLSIIDTSIDMIGLRRLAQHMDESEQIMDIEIPFACEVYVDEVHTKYLVNPLPPLITNPNACSQLTTAALQRNLEAHAACNPAIVPSGTRSELVQRLSDLLTMRRLDMLVMSMLEGNEISVRKE